MTQVWIPRKPVVPLGFIVFLLEAKLAQYFFLKESQNLTKTLTNLKVFIASATTKYARLVTKSFTSQVKMSDIWYLNII